MRVVEVRYREVEVGWEVGRLTIFQELQGFLYSSETSLGHASAHQGPPSSMFGCQMHLVLQNNMMLPQMTVKEVMMFYAALVLPPSTSQEKVEEHIELSLTAMGLLTSIHTLVRLSCVDWFRRFVTLRGSVNRL